MCQMWGLWAVVWLAARVPRGLAYRVCALAGELYFWLNPAHSRKAVENFAVVLADDVGAARVRLMARRSFRNYVKSLFDFFRQMSIDPDLIESDAFVDGWEHLDAGLERGRGILVVTPHFGNWDIAAALTAARGYPIVVLADRFTPPGLDLLVRWGRNRAGVGVVTVDSGALRRTLQLLRRNVIVGIVADRPQREGGVEVEFFGASAWLPAGPARFALRTGAAVILGYIGRRPGDRTFFGGFAPQLAFTPSGDEGADVRALTQMIAREMEGVLRQYPDQWYMFRQMWPGMGARTDEHTEG